MGSVLKVAIFVHCFFPDHFYGTETYTLQLAKNLTTLGHDVTVVAGVFQGQARKPAAISHDVFDGVKVVRFDKNHVPHQTVGETYYQESVRPFLHTVLRELSPDIVHVTHLVNHTAALLEETRALGIPTVATLTDFFGFCFNNKLEAADGTLCAGPNRLRSNCVACYLKAANTPLRIATGHLPYPSLTWAAMGLATRGLVPLNPVKSRGFVHDLVERPDVLGALYENYDAMIAPTHFLRDAYVRNGFAADKLHVSHFGVDVKAIEKPARAASGPLVIGYVGQIAKHKGVDLLVAAVSELPPEKVVLRVYGPEDQDHEFMRRVRSLSGANVSFHGTFKPESISDVMAGFDVLAIPSVWYENSPLVLLNALATQTPVIVSDVQGLTEFVEEGVNGWSFRRADLADLRRLLGRLAEQPDMARGAKTTTSYKRTSMDMTADVEAIYRQVLEARQSGGTVTRVANNQPVYPASGAAGMNFSAVRQ